MALRIWKISPRVESKLGHTVYTVPIMVRAWTLGQIKIHLFRYTLLAVESRKLSISQKFRKIQLTIEEDRTV